MGVSWTLHTGPLLLTLRHQCTDTEFRASDYLCQNTLCVRGSFLLAYRNRGCLSEVKQTIIDMSLNASGVRDGPAGAFEQKPTVLKLLLV